jgi:CCR4-NOT transcription complex subunit 3
LQIEDIRESVDYYIENNQDADFVEDESIYENINLSSVQLGVAGGADSDDDNDDDDDGGSDLDLSSDDDDAAAVDDDDDYDAQIELTKEELQTVVASRAPVSAPTTPSKKPQVRMEVDVVEESATAKPAPPKAPVRLATKQVDPRDEEPKSVVPEKKLPADPEKADLRKVDQVVKRPTVVAPAAPVQPVEEEKREKPRPLASAEKAVVAPTLELSTSQLSSSISASLASNGPSIAPQAAAISISPALTPAPATTAVGVPLLLASLQNSFNNLPESMDSSRPQQYKPKTPFSTPSHYPASPAAVFDNPAVFEKFDTDTLFFIFYYQQGTYQQYLAAKELKRQSWRYHKKYLTWFQRHEEPKEITADYEQGTYVYFDYETGWCQRKKTEFTFQYRYLEDKDLV